MRQILYLFLFGLTPVLYSQQDFGLKVVKELCSRDYNGRGYVNDGHVKAAHYINKRFEEFGLSKFNNNFFQYFTIEANTFPDSVSLYIDGDRLETGIDYLVSPVSGSAKGAFNLRFINRNNIVQFLEDLKTNNVQFDENAFVLDDAGTKNNDTLQLFRELERFIAQKAPVFIINDSKFTWSVGTEQLPFPIVEIKSKRLPERTKKVSLNIHNVFNTKRNCLC
jgi:aminopeptidase YwaD